MGLGRSRRQGAKRSVRKAQVPLNNRKKKKNAKASRRNGGLEAGYGERNLYATPFRNAERYQKTKRETRLAQGQGGSID